MLLAFTRADFINLVNREGIGWRRISDSTEIQNFHAVPYTREVRTAATAWGTAKRRRENGVVTNTVFIDPIYNRRNQYYQVDADTGCSGQIVFKGVIVDERTLVGECYLNGPWCRNDSVEVPAYMWERHPMTWHRIN